jgi:hypothetical protein
MMDKVQNKEISMSLNVFNMQFLNPFEVRGETFPSIE